MLSLFRSENKMAIKKQFTRRVSLQMIKQNDKREKKEKKKQKQFHRKYVREYRVRQITF